MEKRPNVVKYVPITSPAKSFIVPGTCFECYSKPQGEERLKTCGGCRLVAYCSRNCQKQDWSIHKDFCKVAKAQSAPGKDIYSTAKKRIKNGKSWFEIVMETCQLVKDKLGPKFGHIEGKILSVPKVCEFCRYSESSTLKLSECCCAVYYCSEAHLESDAADHKNLCSTFKLMIECDEFMAKKGYPDLDGLPFPGKPASNYEKLPKGISKLINVPRDPIDAIISEFVSYPMSILYTLEKIGLGINSSPVQKAKKLTIHMMDSAQALLRLHMSVTWESLFHRLPNLKRLQIVMIDPELIADFGVKSSNNFTKTHKLCADCEKSGRKLSINVEGDFRMYKCSDRYERPDVILAHGVINLSTGHSILPFPEPTIPLILVGPTREAIEMNLKILSRFEDEDVLKLPTEVNPFRGQRPMRVCKYMSQGEVASSSSYVDSATCFVYANGYICGVQRKMKDGSLRVRLTPNK